MNNARLVELTGDAQEFLQFLLRECVQHARVDERVQK